MSATADIAGHYSKGGLLAKIEDALVATGKDLDALTPEDLHPAEHFHTGGIKATRRFLDQIAFPPKAAVLDIGCGIGGVSRAIACATDAHITGIDLTPDFISTATALSTRVGLADRTRFVVASATDIPMADTTFDVAILVHVGMNIPDKAGVFAQAHRLLKPGGMLAIYEVMEGPSPGPLVLPVPWASQTEGSFLASPGDYRLLAEDAGFTMTGHRDYREAMIGVRDTAPQPPAPGPLGPHLMMGPTFPQKAANYSANLVSGRTTPVEMFFRKE